MKTKILILLAASLLAGCVSIPKFPTPTPPPAVTHESTSSASTTAIQHEVDWQAGLLTVCGVALLVLAGFTGYSGHIVAAVHIGLAGLLLPIFGIWFAYHWLLVVILALLVAAAYSVITHPAVVKKLLGKIIAWAEKLKT